MDIFSVILPFLMYGLMSAVFARFTGINMSMYLLMIFLYMGAKPGETIVAMLLFNTFTYFTVYSQQHVMTMKTFIIFPGVKFIIPLVITLGLALLSPFLGIVFFVVVFLLEIFAKIYTSMNKKIRPTKQQLVQMSAVASVCVLVGVFVIQFIPEQYYYLVAGAAILLLTVLMWIAGDRRRLEPQWDGILYASTFVTGLVGIDATDWLMSMRRANQSMLAHCYPIVINAASIVGLILAYGMYRYFSVGALFATIGASIGIRFFGVPEYSERGVFSRVTIALAIVAALIFLISQPQPTGILAAPVSNESGGLLHF